MMERGVMRLDILIYAHDGRGLGHVSRSLGIAMALRRLYPRLKILFISGSAFTGELLGDAPLDWLKLPSYKTEVVDGTSKGVHGESMFSDGELGKLRRDELTHVVTLYKPRQVLVDHTPQGKHKELLGALEASPVDCQWVLGVRGVVGTVSQAKGKRTRELFQKFYSGLLWYGDSAVLGGDHLQALQRQYGIAPLECGYVSRLGEFVAVNGQVPEEKRWAGVVSVPWLGEYTKKFLESLAVSLKNIGPSYGKWCLFIASQSPSQGVMLKALFLKIPHCTLREPGAGYARELMRARCALIYGGYNSIVDVLYANIPALVILREMKDREQQRHVASLVTSCCGGLTGVSEAEIDEELLQQILVKKLALPADHGKKIKADGAVRAARYLYSRLQAD